MPTKTDKKTINYDSAMVIAEALYDRLEPKCRRIEIAGSLRRKKAYVGDIEIVCIPKYGKARPPGEMLPIPYMNLVIRHIHDYDIRAKKDAKCYTIKKGGPRYYKVIFCSIQCDIFMTNKEQWGRMLALRTGPASFSKKMAVRWKELGYKGHKGELVHLDGEKHRYKPTFPTEKSFFEFLGWDYIEPENRK